MKPDAAESSIQTIVEYIKGAGLQVHLSKGEELTIIGVVGDKSKLATENLLSFRGVDRIVPVTETYKLANRKFHPEPTTVHAGKIAIGPDTFTVMAGPCAVESEEQLITIAKAVKNAGATMLRGGAYKPRTSPYSFQGLEEEGLKYLQEAGTETGLATLEPLSDLAAAGTFGDTPLDDDQVEQSRRLATSASTALTSEWSRTDQLRWMLGLIPSGRGRPGPG